jgi:AraC-like DNA-binding protein
VHPTETALTVDKIDARARKEGLLLELPVAIAGLTGPDLQERRIALGAIHGLWESAVRRLGDRAFPLRCASYPDDEIRSGFIYACAAKQTADEGFRALVRYWPAASSDLAWRIERDRSTVTLVAPPAGPSLGARCAHEFHVIDLVRLSMRVTAGSWAPREVRFSHAPGVPPSVYEDVLGVPVRFGTERVEIVMARDLLAMEIANRTPAHVAPFFEAWAEALLARHVRPPTLDERVRAAIDGELDGGDPSLARVARRLATSERSLHRHLAASGTSFRALLDETRRARALEMLDDSDVSILAIASALGFSDGRAFARAFRRWTGRAPRGRGGRVLRSVA